MASDNLDKKYGVGSAISLILDYLLNVTIGISAGIGAIVSAIPELQLYTLILCLVVLFLLTLVNLRGIRETGMILVVTVILFIGCILITLCIGLFKVWVTGGHPHLVHEIPSTISDTTQTVTYWMLLTAFANGEKIEQPAIKSGKKSPQLKIIKSPYRRIFLPLLNFVRKVRKERKNSLIALMIHELVEPKWYEYLLHNIHAPGLRALLFLERDPRTIVITVHGTYVKNKD